LQTKQTDCLPQMCVIFLCVCVQSCLLRSALSAEDCINETQGYIHIIANVMNLSCVF